MARKPAPQPLVLPCAIDPADVLVAQPFGARGVHLTIISGETQVSVVLPPETAILLDHTITWQRSGQWRSDHG